VKTILLTGAAMMIPGAAAIAKESSLPIALATQEDHELTGLAPDAEGQAIAIASFDPATDQIKCRVEDVRGGKAIALASCTLVIMKMAWVPNLKKANGAPQDIPKIVVKWTGPPKGGSSAETWRVSGGATPLSLGTWMSNDDYPDTYKEGETQFALDVNAMGVATGCRVTKSSGSAKLDKKTCKIMMARALFLPAINADRSPRATTFHSRMIWRRP
jgi:hypothetical protein